MYLICPPIHAILGGQMFVVGRKPATPTAG
jgi:hypothetical protein